MPFIGAGKGVKRGARRADASTTSAITLRMPKSGDGKLGDVKLGDVTNTSCVGTVTSKLAPLARIAVRPFTRPP
jgi:hypothetical protein